MFAKHPEMAKEWAAKTPDMKHLPARVGHMKEAARRMKAMHEKKESKSHEKHEKKGM
jgi:hypothetical protein